MIQLLLKYKSYLFTFLLTLGMIFAVNIFAAEPTRTLGFQGQFYAENTPGNNPVSATFTFYDSLTDGNITGSPITKIINVVNGYFGTTFSESDTTGVNLDQQLYLEISINGVTLSPRTTVNPTVSSLKSFGTFSYAVAPTVGPSGSLYFNTTSQELYVSNGTSWQLSGFASSTTQWVANGTSLNYMAGNVGIGTTTPGSLLTLVDKTGGSTYDSVIDIQSDRALGQQSIFNMYNKNSTDSNGNYFFMTNDVASGVGILSGPTFILNNARPTGEAAVAGETFGQFIVRSNSQSGVRDMNRGGIRFWTPDATTTEFQIGMRAMNVVNGSTFGIVQMVVRNELGTTLVGIGTTTPVATLSVKGRGTATGTLAQFTDSANTSRFTILDNGAVGIGTTTPEYSLDIANGAQAIRSFSNTNAAGGFIRLMHARGTSAVPVVVNSADRLSSVVSQGFDGSSFYVASTMETYVDGAVATGSIPSSMRFSTTPIGGVSRLERMRITNAGFMGIGVTDPDSKLTIIASSTTFANQFTLRSARTALVNGDILGAIDFASNDTNLGSLGSTTASIVAVANTTHTASALGTDLSFRVTNGATTSEALRILGNGNVGIGTSTPSSNLEIYAATSSATLRVSSDGSGLNGRAALNLVRSGANAGWQFIKDENDDLAIRELTGTVSTRMIFKAGGLVGIGTTTPAAILSVVGSSSVASVVSFSSNAGSPIFQVLNTGIVGVGTSTPGIFGSKFEVVGNVALSASSSNIYINPLGASTDSNIIGFTNRFSVGYDGSAGFMGSTGGRDIKLITNASTEVMRLTSGGNVGIGTTTPAVKLSIVGSDGTINTQNTTSSSFAGLNIYDDTGAIVGTLQTGGTGAGTLFAGNMLVGARKATGSLIFIRGGAATESARFDQNGNFGIGTSTPATKLQVNGIIRSGAVGTNGRIELARSSDGFGSAIWEMVGSETRTTVSGGGTYMTWWTNNGGIAERMRLDTAGYLGLGTSTPSQILVASGTIQSTALLGGATTLSTDANGNIIRTPSDQKLKTNVETLTSALDKVNAMRGVSYNWIDTARFGTSSEIGFIAQELETIVPEVVKSGGEYKSVNYQNLTALLTEAIKELSAKFTNLSEVVKTKFVDADKIKTKEFCIGDTCITEQEFKQVLQNRNTSSHTPTPTPAPVVEETPTAEPAQDPVVETPAPTEPAPVETPAI